MSDSVYKGCDWLRILVEGKEPDGLISIIDIGNDKVLMLTKDGPTWVHGSIVLLDTRVDVV